MSSLRSNFSFPRIVGLVAVALATLSSPQIASACDCAFAEHTVPSSNDKNVPTNTKIWSSAFGCTAPVLQKKDGTMVSFTTTKIENVTVIQPDADLELGSTYELTNCGNFAAPTTFTVTEGPDTTPPPPPVFTLGETKASGGSWSSCGEELYVPLDVTFEGALLVLDIAGRSQFDPQKISGDAVDTFFREDKPLVGNAICGPNNWNFDEDGDAIGTRLGAFDLAGNFSGMAPPQTVEAGCTCSTVGGYSATDKGQTIAVLTLLGLSILRKKRS